MTAPAQHTPSTGPDGGVKATAVESTIQTETGKITLKRSRSSAARPIQQNN